MSLSSDNLDLTRSIDANLKSCQVPDHNEEHGYRYEPPATVEEAQATARAMVRHMITARKLAGEAKQVRPEIFDVRDEWHAHWSGETSKNAGVEEDADVTEARSIEWWMGVRNRACTVARAYQVFINAAISA